MKTSETNKTIQYSTCLYPKDWELLDELMDYYGATASDVVRMMIRHFEKVLGKELK